LSSYLEKPLGKTRRIRQNLPKARQISEKPLLQIQPKSRIREKTSSSELSRDSHRIFSGRNNKGKGGRTQKTEEAGKKVSAKGIARECAL